MIPMLCKVDFWLHIRFTVVFLHLRIPFPCQSNQTPLPLLHPPLFVLLQILIATCRQQLPVISPSDDSKELTLTHPETGAPWLSWLWSVEPSPSWSPFRRARVTCTCLHTVPRLARPGAWCRFVYAFMPFLTTHSIDVHAESGKLQASVRDPLLPPKERAPTRTTGPAKPSEPKN